MAVKRVSPAAVVALQNALATVYWYKRDLREFLRRATGESRLIADLDWSDYKRNIVRQFVSTLAENQHRYMEQLISLLISTSEIDPIQLKRLDDGVSKYAEANIALEELRQYIEPYRSALRKAESIAHQRRLAQSEATQRQAVAQEISALREKFNNMHRLEPQRRGYELETLLTRLLLVYDIDARGSFRIEGEQIDGAFTFEGTDYLVEAKWQAKLTSLTELTAFADKVRRRLDNTLGLFVSISGFQESAVKRVGIGNRNVLLLADGYDLTVVFDHRIDFDELLRRKKQHAARTGELMLRAADIIT
ncbi:restriction endonuclease [Mycolicibacterium sphagni]|uniref:Restriction endonuclease type IV Mrr domain-containing protein n=1 Tax=Mycolicibacterium sphagni TaxID=1786 RepID=A0ABX2JZ59_9MYCO|nr:restriction endonuclease [Mycolicibacterium sphagni]NTY60118.1 hypothetical protein [Mycolicibacterium sphagni]